MLSLPVLAPGVYVGQATSKYIRVNILILYLNYHCKKKSTRLIYLKIDISQSALLHIYTTWKTGWFGNFLNNIELFISM